MIPQKEKELIHFLHNLINPTLLRSSPGVVKQPPVVSPPDVRSPNEDFMRRRFKKDDNDDVEIIRPAKQEWCDNGVFVFRKGREVNICIKLPIRVEMEGRYVVDLLEI